MPEAEPRKRRAKWEEMLDTNPAANTLRHPREFRVAGLSHNISQKKQWLAIAQGKSLSMCELRLMWESEHSDGVCNHFAIHPQFQWTIAIFQVHEILIFWTNPCEICSSQEQWWFRCATRRSQGPGGTQTTFEAATLPDLWSTFLVTKLEGHGRSLHILHGFCRVLYMTQYYFWMPSETSSLLPARKAPSVDSGAPFPPVAELEQMPVGDLEGSLPSYDH